MEPTLAVITGASKGIGEDKSVPLYLSASYALTPTASISGLVGVDVGGVLDDDDALRIDYRATTTRPTPSPKYSR